MKTYVSTTDLTTEVREQLQAMFAEAQTTLCQRKQELASRQAASLQKEQAEISNSWAEAMQSLSDALPAWIYPYIQQPTVMYEKRDRERMEYEYAYVSITVPGCNPIAAWITPGRAGTVRYEVLQPHMYQDDDTDVWYVSAHTAYPRRNKWDVEKCGDWDIAVTLFRAHEAYLQQLDMEAEAEQRNAYEPETLIVPAPEPEPEPEPAPAVPDPIDQARDLVRLLSSDELVKRTLTGDHYTDTADSRTLVLASVGLAIAYHISRVADALEESK